jgi:hypothetical protein
MAKKVSITRSIRISPDYGALRPTLRANLYFLWLIASSRTDVSRPAGLPE